MFNRCLTKLPMFSRCLSRPFAHARSISSVTDFRSDTVTKPCAGMLNAMVTAEVGDDVWGDDPTILKLENYVAELTGKESALFCASGTMTNQIAISAHMKPLESILCDRRCHIFNNETGGVALNSRAHMITLEPQNGHHLIAKEFQDNIVYDDDHYARTRMFLLENTLGGSIMPFKEMANIKELATKENCITHLDGARLWNASVATGVSLREYGEVCDTISLCLSKGLGAPVGSILVGDKDFIKLCRRYRKATGGGWRQGGILAAAALYAIENNWGDTMKAVHKRAQKFGVGLNELGIKTTTIETNMMFADFGEVFSLKCKRPWSIYDLKELLGKENIIIAADGYGTSNASLERFVFHHQISDDKMMQSLNIIRTYIESNSI